MKLVKVNINQNICSGDSGNACVMWGYFFGSFEDILQLTSDSQAPSYEQIFKCEMHDFQVRMRDSPTAHRLEDRQKDTVTGMEGDGVGQQRSKPENPSLFSHGYGISDEDRRRLHISRLHYWKWLIYSEERETGRKTDEGDAEPSGDWHSIFLNSNPIRSPEFPYG